MLLIFLLLCWGFLCFLLNSVFSLIYQCPFFCHCCLNSIWHLKLIKHSFLDIFLHDNNCKIKLKSTKYDSVWNNCNLCLKVFNSCLIEYISSLFCKCYTLFSYLTYFKWIRSNKHVLETRLKSIRDVWGRHLHFLIFNSHALPKLGRILYCTSCEEIWMLK